MFVDASAIVAILTREDDADALADTLGSAAFPITSPITSPIAVFEATLGICRKRRISGAEAEAALQAFLGIAGISVVAISAEAGSAALSAYSRYGKGTGHPAQLNLGDCFAYAVASERKTSLLFKGDDFSRTDIPSAMG
jgi:ribonuclease VapC